jgi:hypothetical protein
LTADEVGLASASPTLAGSEDDVLLQALRNVWPLLGAAGRETAMKTVTDIQEGYK